MQYFVSVENSNYFYWQLELLIESFLMHGLQDNLVIAMAENNDPKISGYSKNIIKYGKKILHPNVGKEKEFLPANRFYSLKRLFESGELTLPFCVIHADMIMKNPIDEYIKDFDITINNYDNHKNYLTLDFIKESKIKEKLLEENLLEEKIINDSVENFPYSMPIVFNESCSIDFLNKFFEKLIINLEEILKTKSTEFPVEKTCWIYTFLESLGRYSASSEFLTCELLHSENLDVPFIHYKNGIPPIFNKRFFKYERGKYYEGPYEMLLQNNPTENTEYMIHVVKSYLKRNK